MTLKKNFHTDLLSSHLLALLGDIEPEALSLLENYLEWVSIVGGDTLMGQGEAGDSMFIVISGRLRAYITEEDGEERMVREMARGQIIGEMSLYTNEPRSATVVAIRDSVLVRLDKEAFNQLLSSSPSISVLLTRQIISRLQNPQSRSNLARPVAIGVLPVSLLVDARHLAQELAKQLSSTATACVVDAASVDSALNQPGLASREPGDLDADHRIGLYLDELEAKHEFVLLVADDHPSAWTQRCCRRSDELLLLANADQPPVLHTTEADYLMRRNGRAEALETLVLLHPIDKRCPTGTRQWLARRQVNGHLHIRLGLARDMARLARFQSCTAVGLVLAGGGARGLAHLGIARALHEQGIEIDFVGGTSIGSIMSALIGMDRPWDEVMAAAKKAFGVNPTGDFNLLPLISLIAGRRLKRVLSSTLYELLGANVDCEDLWKSYYCVASNYSKASEHVSTNGNLAQAIMASIAIPGALPPVLHEGDLLCDGGTFNNFPVDVMRGMRGVGRVIGVDLSFRKPRRIELHEVPSSWALLRDRFRAKKQRRYKLPSLVSYLMNVTILYSTSRQRQAQQLTDLCFSPQLERVGMLQWDKFDDIVQQGYEHGKTRLASMSASELQIYRGIGNTI